jgi:hypothetical protein
MPTEAVNMLLAGVFIAYSAIKYIAKYNIY